MKVHPRVSLYLYACTTMLFSLCCGAQRSATTLEIRLPQFTFEPGTAVRLQIILKNRSSEGLIIPKRKGHAEDYLSIQVRDSDGKPLERIDRQSFVKNGKTYSFPKCCWKSRKLEIIRPNDESHNYLVLSDLFNLSKSQAYTVAAKAYLQLSYSGPEIKWIQTMPAKINFAVNK